MTSEKPMLLLTNKNCSMTWKLKNLCWNFC